MTRSRRRLKVAVAVIGLAAVGVVAAVVARGHESAQGKARLLRAGHAVVVVESQDDYDRENGDIQMGTGIDGTLGLINGVCVGFVDFKRSAPGDGSVIVWPPGTSVSGSGQGLRITSEGKTVRLGERVKAGADLRRDFPELDDVIPADCRSDPRVPVGLNS